MQGCLYELFVFITMKDKTYTIKDIARLAGVSAGTVDRVMHNRGEVSDASRIKVQKILDEINYQPNMFAIGLAAKKKYTIYCLIPHYKEQGYWYSVTEGIKKAALELKSFNVSTDFIFYNHSDKTSYTEAHKKLIEKEPDAVLIAPNFRDETLQFTAKLEEQHIPFVFIDVNPDGANALKYIGQNSYQSGYIAAQILMREYSEEKELVLFLSNYRENPAEFQVQRRWEGFMRYLNANRITPVIHEVIVDRDNQYLTTAALDTFFHSHAGTFMGVVFNSRIYQIGQYLVKNNKRMGGLLGYDLLPQNVELLKNGVINFLIGQRPGLQGYCGVKALADKVVFKKEVEPLKYMPIDILLKENIDYYFELI